MADTEVAEEQSDVEELSARDRSRLPDFGEQILADVLKHRGWDIRDGQSDMAIIVDSAIINDDGYTISDASINAPVGTGKTLAYLTGILASGRHGMVCTSTKALQDQIVYSELPRLAEDVKELYGYEMTFSVLKGRSNYACLQSARSVIEGNPPEEDDNAFADMFRDLDDDVLTPVKELVTRVEAALESGDATRLDSFAEMGRVPVGIRAAINANRRCGVRAAKWYDEEGEESIARPLDSIIADSECTIRSAYAYGIMSDIVVANHSLLAADLLKARNVRSMTPLQIPGSEVIVIDEAHHLPKNLASALRVQSDLASVKEEAGRLFKRLSRRIHENDSLGEAAERAVDTCSETIGDLVLEESAAASRKRPEIVKALYALGLELRTMTVGLEDFDSGDEKAAKAIKRAVAAIESDIIEPIYEVTSVMSMKTDGEKGPKEYVFEAQITFDDADFPTLDLVPLDLTFFRDELEEVVNRKNEYHEPSFENGSVSYKITGKSTVILCSGTITQEVATSIGAADATYDKVDSPFDPKRVRLCIPNIPEPRSDEWQDEAIECFISAVRRIGGKTMFLSTSHRNSNIFTEAARQQLPDDYTILYQNNGMSRSELIDTFKSTDKAVLLGTLSLWEGIDIPGQPLSLVVIDKIPFPIVSDNVIQARRTYVEKNGGNAFYQVDVDSAAIMMAQGIGRLQRAESDLGGVMILDSRISNKPYGRQITKLIPKSTPVTDDLEAFEEWMEWVVNNEHSEEIVKADPVVWHPLRVQRKRR